MKITLQYGQMKKPRAFSVDQGTTLADLTRTCAADAPRPLLAGRVRNKIQDLMYPVQEGDDIVLLDMRDTSARIIYEHSLIMVYLKAIEDVLGRCSTEVRNSLGKGIYTEFADGREITAQQLQQVEEHMHELVEQLLFLARGDSGRNTLSKEDVNVAQLVREVCEESSMIDADHAYVCTLDEAAGEDPGYLTTGDAGMLKQCARILTENAMRYSAPGERVTLRTFINDKNESCLCVQDNGIGMRPEDVPHIFERFFRSDKARTREGGTGLGLAIAKWIADAHNASFDVITREGVGTRITLCLPECVQTEISQ